MVSADQQLNVHNKSINKHNLSVQNDIERLTNETPVSDNFRTLNDTNEALSSDFSDFDHTVSFNSLCNHSIVSEAQFPISSNVCLSNSCHTPVPSSTESWFKKKGLNIMHLNIHYLHSKLDEIKILLYEQPNIDIICLCETFLTDKFPDEELVLDNYQLFRKDRNTHGGGLVIYVKNNLICKSRDDLQVNGIEALLLEVKHEYQKPFFLAYTYRPPSSNHTWTLEFENILEQIYIENKEIVLLGDFNINLLEHNNLSQNWIQITGAVNLMQLVKAPTRVTDRSATLIDHAYSNREENIVDVFVPNFAISDHYPVCITLKVSQSESIHRTITYRQMKKI